MPIPAVFEPYLSTLEDDRRTALETLISELSDHLPAGFEACMSYGMPSFSVPHTRYPAGYHCKPDEPLPFVSVASQKNFIGLYHMGMYAIPELHRWFTEEFPKHSARKLDMGKSCVRFKNVQHIPFSLIGQLAKKVTVEEWISVYESNLKK